MTLHGTIAQHAVPGEMKRQARFIEEEEGDVHIILEERQSDGIYDEQYRVTVKLSRLRLLFAQANLGLATTLELINELQARAEVDTVNGELWPSYKPVEHQ